ncbi:guanylate kinase [candidate division KSB1 bacterium]|nr:MAG: guanylate kinase [candidate division KSB1 bacterium]
MLSSGGLIVFASPAGGGKSTVIRRLRDTHPDWGFSVSATTRAPRSGEADGREYYFLSREEFVRRVETGEFLEHEDVHGNLYGTLRPITMERVQRGETLIFDLDVKGALNVKEAFPEALSIFLLPPSREILRQRLEGRKTEPPEVVERRLSRADMELALAPRFDVQIVNDVLDTTVAEVERAIAARFSEQPLA